MANCTLVVGTVRVYAFSRLGAKKIVETLNKIQKEWSYYTEYGISEVKEKDGYIELPFRGSGRWGYSENVGFFGKCVEDDFVDGTADACGVTESEKKYLYENEWSLAYDYHDYDSCSDFLYHQEAVIEHCKNKSLNDCHASITLTERLSTDYYSVYKALGFGFFEFIEENGLEFGPDWMDEWSAGIVLKMVKDCSQKENITLKKAEQRLCEDMWFKKCLDAAKTTLKYVSS